MKCPRCGAPVPEGAESCWECGKDISSGASPEIKKGLAFSIKSTKEGKPCKFTRIRLIQIGIALFVMIFLVALLLKSSAVMGLDIIAGVIIFFVCTNVGKSHYTKTQRSTAPPVVHTRKPINLMTGTEYENYCAAWLRQSGRFTSISVTPPSGDFGADIVAFDQRGRRWVFQCKRYSSKLGNSPIQEVVTAKSHYKAQYAGVITNSTFTDKAKQLAHENRVMLLEQVDGRRSPQYTIEKMMYYDGI